ncbi:MAG: hypothetical protein ABJN61_07920 [Flavobacteriaceae bacterium]|uniref:hypothetical protein n=1 Tax=Nonlabens ulvanivorans TaxID=906888 RepID=UPI003297B518
MKKRKKKALIYTVIVILLLVFFQKRITTLVYHIKVTYQLNNSIVWDESKPLKWSHFRYDSSRDIPDDILTHVGFLHRYHVDTELDYESYTLFNPRKSIVADTTDSFSLRIAQARFDLCEIYRRKLQNEVEILKINTYSEITANEIDKLYNKNHVSFEREWEEFMKLSKDEVELGLINLETRIDKVLY